MIIICLLIIILCVTFTLLETVDDISSKWIFSICVIGFAISIVGMIICVPDMIITHCNTNKKIYTKQLEYESLVKLSKANVIQKVYEWNVEVYDEKYWGNNIWTNWFFNKKVVDSLEYINLEDYGL